MESYLIGSCGNDGISATLGDDGRTRLPTIKRLTLLGARLRELHIRAALVQHEPATLDRQLQASTVFGRRCALSKQEGRVYQLDVDPAVLHDLDVVGDLQQLAGCPLGIGTDYSKEAKFTETVAKKVYYGPVYMRRESSLT